MREGGGRHEVYWPNLNILMYHEYDTESVKSVAFAFYSKWSHLRLDVRVSTETGPFNCKK